MLSSIATIVKSLAGNETLYFDTPVKVKQADGADKFLHLWAVCVSPSDEVFVMCVEEDWHRVEQCERDAQVMEAVFHRVRFMKQQFECRQKEVTL